MSEYPEDVAAFSDDEDAKVGSNGKDKQAKAKGKESSTNGIQPRFAHQRDNNARFDLP